jgi:acyl phosphate:glycerol-3-phosphate acyltransferase
MELFIIIIFSYLSGSIPFGLLLTKGFVGRDVRTIGSGNIGATNVLRTGNKFLAFVTLILDMAKGYMPVILSLQLFPEYIQISSLMCFLGHIFPIWLNFKGGKGVATYLGILFALSISLGFLFIFTWLIVSLIFKYSSLSSMFSSLTIFVVSIFKDNIIKAINPDLLYGQNINFLLFIFFILIIFTHRTNIINLKKKTEQKIKI